MTGSRLSWCEGGQHRFERLYKMDLRSNLLGLRQICELENENNVSLFGINGVLPPVSSCTFIDTVYQERDAVHERKTKSKEKL